MQEKEILDEQLLAITIDRLCHQVIENHDDFSKSVIIGLQPRGKHLSKRIQKRLKAITGIDVPVGTLDITFYRDDFRRREAPLKASETTLPFLIEKKKVLIVDDVLFTGRSIRAAFDALSAYGRPETVELIGVDRQKIYA